VALFLDLYNLGSEQQRVAE